MLDAVNLILPKLGEHPVTRLDNKHPTVAILVPEMENEVDELLLRGWWFNRFDYTAYPDNEGHITLGTETLSFVPDSEPAVLRGLQLYNSKTMLFEWTTSVAGVVTQRVAYDLLPESAKHYILWNSAVSVFATDLGVSNELQLWQGRADKSYSDLLAEHLRHAKHSTRNSRRYRRIMNALKG